MSVISFDPLLLTNIPALLLRNVFYYLSTSIISGYLSRSLYLTDIASPSLFPFSLRPSIGPSIFSLGPLLVDTI